MRRPWPRPTTMYTEGLFMTYGMVFAVSPPKGEELALPVLSARLGVSSANGVAPKDRVMPETSVIRDGPPLPVLGYRAPSTRRGGRCTRRERRRARTG
ncbi:hypothetical protein [Streptomyces sp. cg40]|uniref:hypothetical protein n=1 Tax=Streptomyces sp. cg40 TaxID=3419764 RepID=UPI003D02A580